MSNKRLEWKVPFKRTFKGALDGSSVFNSYDEAKDYVNGNKPDVGTPYDGQVISIYDNNTKLSTLYIVSGNGLDPVVSRDITETLDSLQVDLRGLESRLDDFNPDYSVDEDAIVNRVVNSLEGKFDELDSSIATVKESETLTSGYVVDAENWSVSAEQAKSAAESAKASAESARDFAAGYAVDADNWASRAEVAKAAAESAKASAESARDIAAGHAVEAENWAIRAESLLDELNGALARIEFLENQLANVSGTIITTSNIGSYAVTDVVGDPDDMTITNYNGVVSIKLHNLGDIGYGDAYDDIYGETCDIDYPLYGEEE